MPGGVEGVNTGRGGYFLATTPPPLAGSAGGRGNGGGGGRGGGPAAGMPEERATGPAVSAGRGAAPPVEAPIGMLKAIESGQVKEATITAAVARILGQMDRFGYLEKPPSHVVAPLDFAFNEPVIQKTAEDAAVLLKNDGQVLPLSARELDSVVFIGPGAGQVIAIGLPGGKGPGIPSHQTGPVAAIEKITGRKIAFATANDMSGVAIPASALTLGRDANIDFTMANGKALPTGSSSTWTGTLNVPAEGSYMIALQALGAAASLSLDGQPLLRTSNPTPGPGGALLHPNQDNILPTADGLDNARTVLNLKAGPHHLTATATGEQAGHPVQVRLAWLTPEQRQTNYDAAIAAAKRATKAVVFAWGRDRPQPFHLPGNQDRLIADIAAVNPNTIVVLNTALPVAMPWFDKVKGVVEMWWAG